MSTVSASKMGVELRNMATNMRRNTQLTLYREGSLLLRDIKNRAPVDSGTYQKRWVLFRNRFSSGNILTGISISNNTPYAIYMEQGAEVGGAPWFYPNPKKKRSGKLVRRNGRVWAGGLNPGHANTVGGAIGPIIANNAQRKKKLSNALADSIIGGLK